jgi:hypothetical protein
MRCLLLDKVSAAAIRQAQSQHPARPGVRDLGVENEMTSTHYRCLFDSLAPLISPPVQDQAMLQLHALFGPMLMSALQLIDRREGEWRGSSVLRSIV